MFDEKFNIPVNKPVVLVAPLDWGLGHATRCIPIISELTKLGCTVLVAARGPVKNLLQAEFPRLRFIDLKGYNVRYSRSKFWMPFTLLLQLPKILHRIYAENRWLKKVIVEHNVDVVIADNRMGLYHKNIPCIYITHQLCIKTGSRFTENIAQKIHYHYINKFKACWVPDKSGALNLAGKLSHPVKLPVVPVTYLGPLSRFEKITAAEEYDLCIILSGPEPQRTIFEKIVLSQIENTTGKIYLVRGLPGKAPVPLLQNKAVEIKNHLTAGELCRLILQSKLVISRCGYSSVMDLVKLQRKAILVPTPGQTEQEYLSAYLNDQSLFYSTGQGGFSLPEAIKKAEAFSYKSLIEIDDAYKTVIANFLATLSNQ